MNNKSFHSFKPVSLIAIGFLLGIAGTGLASQKFGSSIFADVKSGMYYDEAIGELNSLGIITGYENGNFGPDDFITRG